MQQTQQDVALARRRVEKLVRTGRLDAHMNRIYTKYLIDHYELMSTTFAIAIPLLSGGTIAVWLTKSGLEIVYVVLGVAVAIMSACQSALKLHEKRSLLSGLYASRVEQARQWDGLWRNLDSPSVDFEKELRKLTTQDSELEKQEAPLRRIARLVSRAQDAVERMNMRIEPAAVSKSVTKAAENAVLTESTHSPQPATVPSATNRHPSGAQDDPPGQNGG